MTVRLAGVAADDDMPPIPTRHHFNLPQRDARDRPSLSFSQPTESRHAVIPPASPEVISNLITSLGAISQPANSHFESHPTAVDFPLPNTKSPSAGSFGVDYGAFTRTQPQQSPLDNLAASPPIVRTSKPTSGYSPFTGAPSPRARSPARDSGSGLRSFIRNSSSASRPSSPGSNTSKHDDAQSIGNLSIERGAGPLHESRPRRSHDSWGKKTARATRGLMYMSSKERLHERNIERKRPPVDASEPVGDDTAIPALLAGSITPAIADCATNKGPALFTIEPGIKEKTKFSIPQHIPVRESSLRKPKVSRARRSNRDSNVILEGEEHARHHRNEAASATPTNFIHVDVDSDSLPQDKSFLLGPDELPTSALSSKAASPMYGTNITSMDYDEGGAPSPAVAQRRREEYGLEVSGGRLSDRLSPVPREALRVKRSSSRLKGLSGQFSPRGEARASLSASPEPANNQSIYPAGYERPASADSVDDAVESYVCSPRLSQKVRHPQTGRTISFSEVGDANGSAVFCCVGMGLTRYITAFYDELALTLKLRLITLDRPGVGDSEPYADGATNPLSWPDDVYTICQALKITKFSILAHSAGAIYALATALRMPQHIRGRLHLLAPWIPPSQMNVFGGSQALPPTNAIPTSQKILRALPTPFLKAANSSFMTATSSSITSSLPKNPRRVKRKSNAQGRDGSAANISVNQPLHESENVDNATPRRAGRDEQDGGAGLKPPSMSENMDQIQPAGSGLDMSGGGTGIVETKADSAAEKERQLTYDARLTHAIWELATTGANPAVDLLVCLERRQTIGFRYVDITRPVVIHHGSRDSRVPVENVKWLGKTMRRCEVRVLEGEGHGLMASATVMGAVLMEMSKEWEDWMRVTGADRRDRDKATRR